MKLFDFLQVGGADKLLGGRYRLISLLGEGGFGQTFLAEDLHLPGHPRCVVKRLKPMVSDRRSLEIATRLFNTEAQVLYQLGSHDQIPRLLAHFEDGQEFYLVQELVNGYSLPEELVPGQPWSEQRVLQLLQEILEVLAFVHSQNVIHRDIKPANLMRRFDGKIVLIDFGAVKQVSTQLIHPDSSPTHTVSIGTQGYMPNEQLAGNPRFSSDVYAVGMIGIQALTGCLPKQLRQDSHTSELVWHDRAVEVSSELATVLDKMVCYDFRSRYPSAAEALAALQQIQPDVSGTASEEKTSSTASRFPTNNVPPALIEQLEETGESLVPSPDLPSPSQPLSPATDLAGIPEVATNAASLADRSATVGTTAKLPTRSQTLQIPLPTLVVPRHQFIGAAAGLVALTGLLIWLQPGKSPQTSHSHTSSASPTASPSPPAQLDQVTQIRNLLTQATQQREAKQYKSSLNLYQQVVKLDAKSAEAHWGRCYNLNFMNQADAAISACNVALKLRPNYPEALWSKGYALEQQRQYSQALQLYERAIALKPNFAEAWNNKGTSLLLLSRPGEALVAFDRAIALKADLAQAWSNRGAALWSLRRPDESIASIDQAIALQPNYKDALSLRQQIRERFGR